MSSLQMSLAVEWMFKRVMFADLNPIGEFVQTTYFDQGYPLFLYLDKTRIYNKDATTVKFLIINSSSVLV